MPEYQGSGTAIALQQRIRARAGEISASPHLVNGARLVHYLDPQAIGWDRVRGWAEEDQLAGFPFVDPGVTQALIHDQLGPEWKTPTWLALQGDADEVLSACEAVIQAVPLPEGWTITAETCSPPERLEAAQALNAATGVSPYPAYYMRSEDVPVLTVCLLDDAGQVMATASVADRYDPASRLGGYVFAGMVSVAEAARGLGLGKRINAEALVRSHALWSWDVATEQVAPDNAASLAMIRACGLSHKHGLVAMAAINSDERFTR